MYKVSFVTDNGANFMSGQNLAVLLMYNSVWPRDSEERTNTEKTRKIRHVFRRRQKYRENQKDQTRVSEEETNTEKTRTIWNKPFGV